ncbi:MAG: LptE family protein [Gemmatimonadales bacterium]
MSRSPLRSGAVRSAGALALLLAAGCLYHFSGGGLPSDVKTVAILPFDNKTGEPALTQEANAALRDAVESRLGLREASEANADAVVRGEIVRYDPDIPLSYQAGQGTVEVTRRRVQIVLNVELYDQKHGKSLWKQSSLTVDGEYQPPAELSGRTLAWAKLVTQVVEGAQSQW